VPSAASIHRRGGSAGASRYRHPGRATPRALPEPKGTAEMAKNIVVYHQPG